MRTASESLQRRQQRTAVRQMTHDTDTSSYDLQRSVAAQLAYGARSSSGQGLFNYIDAVPEGEQRTNIATGTHDLLIRGLRASSEPLTLRQNGFQLEAVDVPDDVDWLDETQASLLQPLHRDRLVWSTLTPLSGFTKFIAMHRSRQSFTPK